ncbi:hypothetical protein NEHOM01_1466 [Nematocida homosporus]|uniref:uncharacterized protein n=1 Tax=Nematocida homosporus TaxID=1912981 RepID=UPI00221F9D92|nr:uncharacterized protein NEHOM01_1466 [Nematocida homosporus]KAI5186433.1 hypothetical protein NEHOM01_1466 [Nematocida homosporus]
MDALPFTRGPPIKEHDHLIATMERENFELKMQISHLKAQLREHTMQTNLSINPPCDCKKKSIETNQILAEAKSAMETLLAEKESLESLYTETTQTLERMQEEKTRLKNDCIKLSEHIAYKHQKEQESQQALQTMRAEIVAVKSNLEENEMLKEEISKISEAYRAIKEEYVKLDEFAKSLETDFKSEVNQKHQIVAENETLKSKLNTAQQKLEELVTHATNLEKQQLLGEKVVEELKKEKRSVAEQVVSVQSRAEGIIAEREKQISYLQNRVTQLHGSMQRAEAEMQRIVNGVVEEIKRVELATGRTSKTLSTVDDLDRHFQRIVSKIQREQVHCTERLTSTGQMAARVQEEAKAAAQKLEAAREENAKLRQREDQLNGQIEDLQRRIHLTPEALAIAGELGIRDFTTLSDLFIKWSADREKNENWLANCLEEKEKEHQHEARVRNRKLDEFQTKLQTALSELNICRAYLEEKKSLIKALKKSSSTNPIMKQIEISTSK